MPLSRRQFLSAAATAPLAAQDRAGARPPNILLMMTDSLRAECLGCYGNNVIKTPHLDALARQGVRFSHAITQHTVCMPTRSTLMTGRYPHVHGVWANGVPLAKSEITLPAALARAGYHTWMTGKLHLEPILKRRLPADGSMYYGFKEYAVSDNDLKGPYLDFVRQKDPRWLKQAAGEFDLDTFSERDRKKPPILPEELQQSTWIADRTIDFLHSRRNTAQPFFAFASFIDPRQTTYNPPEPYNRMYPWDQVPPPQRRAGELERKPPHQKRAAEHLQQVGLMPEERELREVFTQYYGSVSFVDANLGRILRALDEEHLAGNTIVIFTVDHGELIGDHWLRLKGPWMYDLVTRVPMIWRWPGRFRQGVREQFAAQVDLMPTVLDLATVACPAGVQGASLAPLLRGEEVSPWRDAVLTEDRDSSELAAHGMESRDLNVKAIRTKDWKLVVYQGKPYGELYDLRNDPKEFDNLWDDPARRATREELTARLLDLYVSTDNPLPERLAPY